MTPFVAVGDPRQTRAFYSPCLFCEVFGFGWKTGLGIDLPVRDAVVAAGDGQMGMASAVFDPHQVNRFVTHLAGACVDTVFAGRSLSLTAEVVLWLLLVGVRGGIQSKEADFEFHGFPRQRMIAIQRH